MNYCPAGGERPLTHGEIALAHSMFGRAVDYAPVRIKRRRWWWFQPRDIVMAPCGHLHFHPLSEQYCDDFAAASLEQQGLFIHEMTHVWQSQARGRYWLPLMRHPFCRYDYRVTPGRPLHRYGIEQQAEIVRHAFLLKRGLRLPHLPQQEVYEQLVAFN